MVRQIDPVRVEVFDKVGRDGCQRLRNNVEGLKQME